MIWPPDEWAMQRDLFRRTAETPLRSVASCAATGNSSPFDFDAQGRLLLSAHHRAFAQIVDHGRLCRLDTGVEITADELWQEQEELDPDEFTQVWDLVHQRGTSASPSPA